MEEKVCRSCQSPKPLAEFWKHSGFKDGLNCNCKYCEREAMRHRERKRADTRPKDAITEKKCSACGLVKPASDFFRDKSKKHGLASSCQTCTKSRAKDWVAKNPERVKENSRIKSEEKRRSIGSYYTYWKEFTEYDKPTADRIYRESNLDRVKGKVAAYRVSYRGRAVKNECNRRYRFQRSQSTPAWANRAAILEFYANCPPGMHVDHIIPIQGKLVCGLHVLENLQYLTALENSRKTNKFVIHGIEDQPSS